jgi:DMSO/TMAO reductase YedYZ heme-binding membrane subunit
MIEYILLGILAPIFLNLMHLVLGIFVVTQRGSVMSLGFTGISFITKTFGMIFLTWLGVGYLGLDMRIFVPLLAFFWFFTHVLEAFVIQHYIQLNVPKTLQDLNDRCR